MANGVASQNGVTTAPAKIKGKKNGTVQDKGEILRQKILQLEQTEAADREQEAEIGKSFSWTWARLWRRTTIFGSRDESRMVINGIQN